MPTSQPKIQLTAVQRYSTLQNLGTRLWVPKFIASGAAPSPSCPWQAEPAKQSSSASRNQLLQQLAATSTIQVPPQTIASAKQENLKTLSPEPSPAAAPTVANYTSLSAEVWLLANGWQLVMLPAQNSQLATERLQLIHAVLRAFYPSTLAVLSQETFNWPLAGLPVEITTNASELASALQAFLTGARLQEVRLAGCLVFGPELQELLLSANSQSNSNLQPNSNSQPNYFAAPCLEAMLQQPQLKQEFWQQAGQQGLRAAFASAPLVV